MTYHFNMDAGGNYTVSVIANPSKFNTKAAQALLTDAGIDWKNDPDFQIPGVGTQLRVTKPRKGKHEEDKG